MNSYRLEPEYTLQREMLNTSDCWQPTQQSRITLHNYSVILGQEGQLQEV